MAEKKVKKVATVKKTKKEVVEPVEKKTSKKTLEFSGEYFYGLGKRKTSIAQVKLFPTKKSGSKAVLINNQDLNAYFSIERHRDCLKEPFEKTGLGGEFGVWGKVSGGGVNSQAEALRLAVSRAIVRFDEVYRKVLRDLGFLTRDSRVVERKKPGFKKARRSPQWAKR